MFVLSAIVFCGTMIYAAVTDLLFMKIHNTTCLILAAGFLILASLNGMTYQVIGIHIITALIALIICFGLFSINAMGGGDAKLISATVLWTGFSQALADYVLITAIAGGLLTVLILLFRRFVNRDHLQNIQFLYRLSDPAKGIPYGIALAFAGLWVFPALPILF